MTAQSFVVEWTGRIEGRGLVIVGFTADQHGMLHVGQQLTLKRPDGSIETAIVRGIEFPSSVIYLGERPTNPRYGALIDFLEVPIGTEVYFEFTPQRSA